MSNTCPCLSKMTQHVAHATLVGASMLGIICMNERREIQHMTWSSSPGKLIAKKKKLHTICIMRGKDSLSNKAWYPSGDMKNKDNILTATKKILVLVPVPSQDR